MSKKTQHATFCETGSWRLALRRERYIILGGGTSHFERQSGWVSERFPVMRACMLHEWDQWCYGI